MFKLIALGVLLLAIMAAIGTVIVKHDNKVKAATVAVWKPLFDQQVESTNTAVGAAEQNLATAHLYRDQAQECSRGTSELERSAKEAKAQAALDLAAKQGRLNQLESDRKKHQQQTTTPDGATCEQKLGTIGGIVVDLGARRMRDHPPGAEGGNDRGAAPAPGQNPGADTLRLTR